MHRAAGRRTLSAALSLASRSAGVSAAALRAGGALQLEPAGRCLLRQQASRVPRSALSLGPLALPERGVRLRASSAVEAAAAAGSHLVLSREPLTELRCSPSNKKTQAGRTAAWCAGRLAGVAGRRASRHVGARRGDRAKRERGRRVNGATAYARQSCACGRNARLSYTTLVKATALAAVALRHFFVAAHTRIRTGSCRQKRIDMAAQEQCCLGCRQPGGTLAPHWQSLRSTLAEPSPSSPRTNTHQ